MCRWATKKEQANNTSKMFIFDAIAPNGNIYKDQTNITEFCRQHNLDTGDANRRLNNKPKSHLVKGWDFVNKKYVLREEKGFDQLDRIINTLKTNPDDRRLLCSAWNPNQLQLMALPPCHLMFVLTHIDGEVSLHWTQR